MTKEKKSALPKGADTTPVQSLPSIFLGIIFLGVFGGITLFKLPFHVLYKKVKG